MDLSHTEVVPTDFNLSRNQGIRKDGNVFRDIFEIKNRIIY